MIDHGQRPFVKNVVWSQFMLNKKWLHPYIDLKCGCDSIDLFIDGESMYKDYETNSIVIEVTCKKCGDYFGIKFKPVEKIIYEKE